MLACIYILFSHFYYFFFPLYVVSTFADDLWEFVQVDLDLGNYERFLDVTLTRENNITTGKIYQASSVIYSQALPL